MAFQAPTVGQERANRKILEQLEEQKKRLRLQHNPQNNSGSSNSSSSAAANPVSSNSGAPVIHMAMDSQQMTVAQKTAMQHAMANSVGYFITQDSSFGNLILPVLPRYDK
ncbi:SOSS complex subunit C-like [Liolophura sinensis]|uniref:SOSS complex subunit C-like n=1 Tax=Liolophura sinensis TaxID=3198878 RepID=UPI0031582B6C